jgi:hypothetical protein
LNHLIISFDEAMMQRKTAGVNFYKANVSERPRKYFENLQQLPPRLLFTLMRFIFLL